VAYVARSIVLSDTERGVLEARVRATTSAQRDVKRSRVILMAADGLASRQISKVVGIHESHVAMWRQRFLADRIGGLADLARPGPPPKYGHDDRIKIAAMATLARDPDEPEAAWTYQTLADALADDVGVSRSQLWRILRDMDIRVDQVKGWLNRRDDPEFWERVQDICGLYLSPPLNAVLISVDEKTGIQAKERLVATRPAGPGRSAREEFEYVRHGTVSLMTAFEVTSGQVLTSDIVSNNSTTFIDFLDDIDRSVDPKLDIHLVMDNGSSHVSKATKAWLVEHARFNPHYTPVHASWVNQVELFFSILTRKVLKRGNFSSRDDLVSKLMKFVVAYNETARPFAWTYAGTPLKVGS